MAKPANRRSRGHACTWLVLSLVVIAVTSCDRHRITATVTSFAMSPSHAEVNLGRSILFSLGNPLLSVDWSVTGGPGHGIISRGGRYQAPYFLPPDPSLTVEAHFGGGVVVAPVTILDVPAIPSDCYGGQQSELPAFNESVLLDKAPVAIMKVAPAYPDSAREAGVSGMVSVAALVCASGLVYDTRVTQSIPLLDAAAVAVVKQWVFAPAMLHNKPAAAWVECPIRFTIHVTKEPGPGIR